MKYYNITGNWKRIKLFLSDKELNDTLVSDFNKYTFGLWRSEFKHGMKPFNFESCDWHCERKGRRPAYWDYVKHAACHWVVNFNLKLAMLVSPKREWRIVTSQDHSTVWDGKDTLFDMNFLALGVPADEAFEIANKNKKQLPIGQKLKVHFAQPKK